MPSVFPDEEVPDAAVADRVEMKCAMFGAPRPSMRPNTEGPDCDTVICNPKIAIIDDQPINIKVVQRYLKLAGYQRFFTTVELRSGRIDPAGRAGRCPFGHDVPLHVQRPGHPRRPAAVRAISWICR